MGASCAGHLTPVLTSIAYYVSICALPMTDVVNLGEFEHMVLLAIMRLGDDAYAVPVREEIVRCTGRDVSRGSIYITLDRLETKGYLRSRLADPTPERGGRAKRYYVLRPRAIDALKESRRALVALWRGLETALG
jgi:DNA-binding PadR family transcriptional regulator